MLCFVNAMISALSMLCVCVDFLCLDFGAKVDQEIQEIQSYHYTTVRISALSMLCFAIFKLFQHCRRRLR